MAFILTLMFVGGVSALAADIIRVEAKIIDAPATLLLEKADIETKAWLEYPDLNVLQAPKLILIDGKSGTIRVQETKLVRSAEDNKEIQVPSGVQLKILPKINGDTIDFTANVTVRNLERDDKSTTGGEAEFSTREFYFSGSCKDGASVFMRSKGVHNNRRVSLLLLFSRQKETDHVGK